MKATSVSSTRERILHAAEAVLGEHGYGGTRLHEIARRVGVQKASLFHYFSSKEELYRAVLEEGFGDTEQTIRRALGVDGTPLDRLVALVEAFVDMVVAHPARTKILLRQSLGDAPGGFWQQETQRLLHQVVDFIAKGQRAKRLGPADPQALVVGIVGMVAFFFTSAPILAPSWFGEHWSPTGVQRVKQHIVELVERCLTVNDNDKGSSDDNDPTAAGYHGAQERGDAV